MRLNKIFVCVLIFLLGLYKNFISPFLRKKIKCRFYPTCSDYSLLALKKYGFFTGIKKIITRLAKCNKYNLDSCIDYP